MLSRKRRYAGQAYKFLTARPVCWHAVLHAMRASFAILVMSYHAHASCDCQLPFKLVQIAALPGVQVIDAEMARRKILEDSPIPSTNEEPVFFDTAEIPWWAWVRRFHLPEVRPPSAGALRKQLHICHHLVVIMVITGHACHCTRDNTCQSSATRLETALGMPAGSVLMRQPVCSVECQCAHALCQRFDRLQNPFIRSCDCRTRCAGSACA